MKHPKVVLTYPLNPSVLAQTLPASRFRLTLARTRKEVEREIRDADALLCLVTNRIDAPLLDLAPKLRVIGNCAVGIDNIDQAALLKRKIRLVNTPDVLTYATAELSLALLLAAARRLPEGEAMCRAGRFKGWTPDLLLGHELKGRHALIVGYGRIGREVARLYRALGMTISWVTRTDSSNQIAKKLRRADVVSLHLSFSSETHHWLSRARLALLKPESIVINTSRGAVIDERALIQALQSRRIWAAGLDVFEFEPKVPSTLRALPNTVLLPHVGSATYETRSQMVRLASSGIASILNGKRPPNEVRLRPDP